MATCDRCRGHKTDPEDPGDWVSEVGMYDPYSASPCEKCEGTGELPEPARTTKTVTATLTATFHGDYLDKDEVGGSLESWIDSGLEDRDDLRGWTFQVQQVEEVSGDPNGYDD